MTTIMQTFKPKISFCLKFLKVNVSSLSPLATAFNKCHLELENVINNVDNVGLFGISELKTADGFNILKDNMLTLSEDLIKKAIQKSPSPEVIFIFDDLSNELCKVADLAEFVRVAHPVKSFEHAAESTSFEIGGYVEKLNTHYDLYNALNNSFKKYSEQLDPVTKMVASLFLFDFEQSGIHLDVEKKRRAVEMHEASLMLGARFTQNAQKPRLFSVSKWPKEIQIPFKVNKSNIIVDSNYSESSDPKLREICYKAFMSECEEQSNLLNGLLYARKELSNVLGFESFPHRVLKGTSAANPTIVLAFLEKTLAMVEKYYLKEMGTISDYKKKINGVSDNQVKAWDMRYYTSLLSSQAFNITSKTVSEYFSVGACMDGLNIIFTSLYGVSLNVVTAGPGELWASDVQKVEVRHESEGVLGYIYCDFFQRANKFPQDCHFTIKGGKLLSDGTYQLPVVAIMCNFPCPGLHSPSLLTQGNVENLFHEMGHAMHSMLGRSRFHHVTGTRCPTDFAEVPSILMEYFATDKRILPLYAKHYKTGQSLPEEIIDALNSSKKQFPAIDLHTQTFYSIVDQKIHSMYNNQCSTMKLVDSLHKEYSPITYVPGAAWHLRFSHFHSYGAKYYAYVWSKAIASQIWFNCFEHNPLSRVTGEKYRETMLRHGGGRPPHEMVEDMIGKKVSTKDLVNSLETDLYSFY
ncbi:mitochondrial intermediate peptidase [Hydra vulgaris]|uniref:Mitochondrial intermediate peptidase n=1 Tax=Hydra vulgaris TaxID=6087 RepID=A0ABM4B5A6_HYDVU